MRVVAFNGSPRKDGNTTHLIRMVFAELEKAGIDTELVQLAREPMRGCTACYRCFQNKDRRCSVKTDFVNTCIEKMDQSDAIILASPTYFASITAEMKALIDRAGLVARANDDMFRRKVGAAVVAVRRSGAMQAFNCLNSFFLIGQMVVPGSCYWNMAQGRGPGDVEDDAEGKEIMRVLGENMAWLLHRLSDG